MGDEILYPGIYRGIGINHYKDPSEPISIMECHKGFYFVAHLQKGVPFPHHPRYPGYGKKSVDVAAPGSDIYSTIPNGDAVVVWDMAIG